MRLGEPAEQRRLPRRRRPRRRRRRRERRGRRRRRADADGTRRRAARRTALLQQRPLRCEQLQSQKRPRHVVHVATTEFAVESSPSPESRITSSSQLPPAKPQLAVAPQQPRPVCLIRRGGLAPRSRIHPTGRGRRSRHRRLLSLIKRCAHTVRAGDAEAGIKSVKIATTERASEGVFRGSGQPSAASRQSKIADRGGGLRSPTADNSTKSRRSATLVKPSKEPVLSNGKDCHE